MGYDCRDWHNYLSLVIMISLVGWPKLKTLLLLLSGTKKAYNRFRISAARLRPRPDQTRRWNDGGLQHVCLSIKNRGAVQMIRHQRFGVMHMWLRANAQA